MKTPVRHSGHFAVGGWTGRAGMVGSLLVGGYDGAGGLVYCGRVMSGLSQRGRRELWTRLSQIGCQSSPFANAVDDGDVRWVHPVLVGRVEYREFTGRLRHAAWKGITAVEPTLALLPEC